MASTITNTRPIMSPMTMQHLAQNLPPLGKKAATGVEGPVTSKLKTLDPETLAKLERTFFETATGATPKAQTQSMMTPFGVKPPTEAFAQNLPILEGSFFRPELYEAERTSETKNAEQPHDPLRNQRPQDPKSPRAKKFYAANLKSSGVFSNPAAEKASEAVRQSQKQTQNFLANQFGEAFAAGNMAEFLGPNACFEDALAAAMIGIADRSEKEVLEQIRTVERGETGFSGAIANGARGIGGMAGGAIGGYLAGTQGAAIGHDIGDRLAGNVANQYGGSSRQVQFEKLKMTINKQAEMMSAISNIMATIHSTNKNAISNMRG